MIEYGIKVKLGILSNDVEAEPISLYNIVHSIGDIPCRSSILQLLAALFMVSVNPRSVRQTETEKLRTDR